MLKSAAPINDNEITDFLKSLSGEDLFSYGFPSPAGEHRKQFIEAFNQWIQLEDYFDSNLDHWTPLVTSGTTESFLDFYLCQGKQKTFVFTGEYPFHRLNGIATISDIESIPSQSNLIISFPFSASGDQHPKLKEILTNCDKKEIKVLLDCALLPISHGLELEIMAHKCIERIAFSLSKSFSSGRFRSGVSFIRNPIKESPLFQLNDWSYLDHLSLKIHIELMKNFNRSYLLNKYRDRQLALCQQLDLDPSATLIFGTSTDTKYKEYSRQGFIHRVCLSDELSNIKSPGK